MSFAGVSVIADGKLLQSAAYSGTAGGSGYHLLAIEGYSRVKDTANAVFIKSRSFSAGGYRWALNFYPYGRRSDHAGFVSVYLALDQDVAQPVKVHRQFSFIDEIEQQEPGHIRAIKPCDFTYRGDGWANRRLIKVEDLEKSSHLKDDCFTLRCDFIVVEAAAAAPFIDVPPSNICEHLKHLLAEKVGADVTFEVGCKTFTAHPCVLTARSTVFMTELFGPMKEGTTPGAIQIKDMEPDIFEALLGFIYTDSILKMEVKAEAEEGKVENVTWLQHLLAAADRYHLQRLKSMCEERLSGRIDVSSVAAILGVAAQHHCCGLKEACLEFLKVQSAADLQGVMATSDWEQIVETIPSVLNELIAKFASKG